jgi:hypothetical protein
MTFDIALVLAVLVGAVILFVTEKLRVDVVAMLLVLPIFWPLVP